MARPSIAAAWTSYAGILPATAGEIQRTETRRAFYAGATALFAAMVTGIQGGPGAVTREARVIRRPAFHEALDVS